MNVSYLYTFSVSRCWMSYYKTHRYSLGQPLSLQPLSATMQRKITAWVKPLSLHVNKITAWVKPLSLHVNKITAWVQPLSLHANYELDWITAMLVACVSWALCRSIAYRDIKTFSNLIGWTQSALYMYLHMYFWWIEIWWIKLNRN